MIVLSIAFAPIVELINQNSQIILLANRKFISFRLQQIRIQPIGKAKVVSKYLPIVY
jgi:hypothetical protein